MAVALGNLPSNAPLPTGTVGRKIGAATGAVLWPQAENWILPGGGDNGRTRVFSSSRRFLLNVGASIITQSSDSSWVRRDYKLQLIVNGAYGNDLNGINFFRKANTWLNTSSGDPWMGCSLEGLFYCEANTNYEVDFLSAYYGGTASYFQDPTTYTFWAHTLGEGAY